MFVRFIIITAAIIPFIGNAQSVLLSAPKTSYRAGDSFQVSVVLNTNGNAVNAISGIIKIPTNLFQILDVRYGNSIVSLWVERPVMNAALGTVSFVGGIPGGYNGSSGTLLNFGLKARAVGQGTAALEGVKILLNDGLGTEAVNVTTGTLSFSVAQALPRPADKKSPETVYVPPSDTTPPEKFVPVVNRHPTVGENRYFVSFFAVDKDSGIARYEIEERPWLVEKTMSRWNVLPAPGESPYILKQQWWATRVVVRAYDQAGNFREAAAFKPFHPGVLGAVIVGWTMGIAVVACWIVRRKFIHSKRRR